jgi:hypothetical protein
MTRALAAPQDFLVDVLIRGDMEECNRIVAQEKARQPDYLGDRKESAVRAAGSTARRSRSP